jgi:hypothetical protein
MQRIASILAVCAPVAVAAQETAATQMWHLAGTTLAVPQALAIGGASAVWNPAQPPPIGRASVCLEIIQTPAPVGAAGVLAVGRIRLHPLGEVGVVYGNMQISNLLRTTFSPVQDSGSIPYYAQFVAADWTLTRGGTTLGATFGLQEATLDETHRQRAVLDLGIVQLLPASVRIAVAVVAPVAEGDPSDVLYGGIERRMWRGTLWRGSGPASFSARYGVAVGHDFTADHQFGIGLEVGALIADVQVAREDGYGAVGWRGSAGIRIRIGHYRLIYARDAGISDIGSAYRIGLEAQVK